jgi:hypothetical protein
MKIDIEHIAGVKLNDKVHITNSILKFKRNNQARFVEKIDELTSNATNSESRIYKLLFQNQKDETGEIIKLMSKNLQHIHIADFYFSNGQNILSLIKTESDSWEIGNFKSIFEFVGAESIYWPMTKMCLNKNQLKLFKEIERAENYITEQLNILEVTQISTINGDEYSIQECYPNKYYVDFNNGQKKAFDAETDGGVDVILKHIEERLDNDSLKICLTCKHFGFSGMSHDMSGELTGYCHKVRNKLEEKSVPESITQITNVCSKHEVITNE